jgi:hypothetical protein
VTLRSAVIAVCIAFSACGGKSEGETEVLLKCLSSDGQTVAVFYREFGGGAAGWQYEFVSVSRSDDYEPAVVLKLKSGYDVNLRWTEPSRLEIGYPDTARVDHWQNWFGRADGKVELLRLPSRNGMFLGRKGSCER